MNSHNQKTPPVMPRAPAPGAAPSFADIPATASQAPTTVNPPQVSVVIVTLNRREDLAECLTSVQQQTYPSLEVIVVDNASTDGTSEMVNSQFEEIKLIQSSKNTGCPGGRNLGASRAEGKYIFFLDDDATLDPDALNQAVTFLEARPQIVAVTIAVVSYYPDGRVQAAYDPKRLGISPRLYPGFSGGASLIRRHVFSRFGGFNSDFIYGGEERELALRLMKAGHFMAYLPSVCMHHKQSPGALRDEVARLKSGLHNDLYIICRYFPRPLTILAAFNKALYYFKYSRNKGKLHDLLTDLIELPGTVADMLASNRDPVPLGIFFYSKLLERLAVSPDETGWLTPGRWLGRSTKDCE